MQASRNGTRCILAALLWAGCVLSPAPRQMYDGPPLPRDRVGIVHSGCVAEDGLTIMVAAVDGKNVEDPCADFALLPGEHRLDLTAERRAPPLGSPMMGSGGVLGASPSATSGGLQQSSRVVWQSQLPLPIACTIRAGQDVVIVGTGGTGPDWQARCQERAR